MKKKLWGLVLLLALLLLGTASFEARAEEVKWFDEEIVYVNPLYADAVSEEDLKVKAQVYYSTGEIEYHETVEEAGAVVRDFMEERAGTIVVGIRRPDSSNQVFYDVFNEAIAHTGEPTEGDYLAFTYAGWSGSGSYIEDEEYCYLTLTFSVQYYTTAEQEAEMNTAVDNLLAQLNLDEADDYTKVCGIYDYMCDNILYDYANLKDDSHKLKYTAYAALVNGTSVCQGYANLFYRLALELGVDARIIAGDAGGPHSWNIVKLGNVYYNLDATWDAGRSEYDYFLQNPEGFSDHYRETQYETAEFHAAYPMSTYDYADRPDDGDCGEGEISEQEGVEAFVSRLYTVILGRNADEEGLNSWVNQLISGTKTGVDVTEGFILSKEFIEKELSDEAFVQTMYRAFFDREADEEGLATWLGYLEQDYVKEYIFARFAGSDEFADLCANYGIARGNVEMSLSVQTPHATGQEFAVWQFVERFYNEFLDRAADYDGLKDWADKLLAKTHTGVEVAEGFFLSEEFRNAVMTDEAFVNTLYRAFFNRPADEGGLAKWTGLLKDGYGKKYIFGGLAVSDEFEDLCESFGIDRGKVYLTLAEQTPNLDDRTFHVWQFVERFYIEVLGRVPDLGGLKGWADKLISGTHSGAEVARGFILSAEFLEKDRTKEEFIGIMYRAFFGREADDAGLASWLDRMAKGETEEQVVTGFVASEEFGDLCEAYGIVKE